MALKYFKKEEKRRKERENTDMNLADRNGENRTLMLGTDVVSGTRGREVLDHEALDSESSDEVVDCHDKSVFL